MILLIFIYILILVKIINGFCAKIINRKYTKEKRERKKNILQFALLMIILYILKRYNFKSAFTVCFKRSFFSLSLFSNQLLLTLIFFVIEQLNTREKHIGTNKPNVVINIDDIFIMMMCI